MALSRGSRYLDEPTLYRHPDTGRERTATTKVQAVQNESEGYRRAAELDEADNATARSEAAKKAAETRRRNAAVRNGSDAADATATETTEPNSGSGE